MIFLGAQFTPKHFPSRLPFPVVMYYYYDYHYLDAEDQFELQGVGWTSIKYFGSNGLSDLLDYVIPYYPWRDAYMILVLPVQ